MPAEHAIEIEKLRHARAQIDEVIEALRVPPATLDDAPWFTIAKGEIGVKEIRGAEDNPRVLEYLRSTSLGKWAAGRDETAWCSALVNWCVEEAGLEGTNNAMARSWLGWGVEIDEPREGCIVVLKRGDPPSGHVAFFGERDAHGGLMLLGGNQRNEVRVSEYDVSRVLSYRWPAS